jgi:hypothetical protein
MNLPNREAQISEERATDRSPSSRPQPSTRKPSQNATHAVLFTPELLCNITLHLPLEDVVTTTGVCHFWRDATAADPAVQKALFLCPENVRRMLVFPPTGLDLERAFSDFKTGDTIPDDLSYTIGRLHPFLHRICGVFNTRKYRPIDWEGG